MAAPVLGTPGKVVRKISNEIISEGNFFSIPTADHRVLVEVISDDIIRVGASPDAQVLQFRPSQLTSLTPQEVKTVTTISPEIFSIATATTQVNVDRRDGLVTFLTLAGDTIVSEALPLDNTSGAHIARFLPKKSESWYGAGERGHAARLNGDSLSFYNRPNYGYGAGDPRISQTGISVPYVVSDAGYGLLFDDAAPATLLTGDTLSFKSEGKYPLSYFFINGDGSIKGTTQELTALTGRQDLPPFWTLGYVTSKYGYHNREEALGAIDSLKRNDYPVDGIVFDLYWYGTETDMGRLEWDEKQFPQHRSMLDSLRRMGVNTVLIHQPYINKKGAIDNYNLLAEKGLLVKDADGNVNDVTTWVGDAGMFDMSNPATRQWLWDRISALTAEGVAGWWGDLGEPEVHPLSMVHDNGLSAAEYHNRYGNDWSQFLYEGLRRDFPDMRPMLMMRGGTAGLQRYSVFPWTGDVARSWPGLQAQVNLMLSAGLSGLGYMSSDLGGFAVDPASPVDSELYARWLEMGAFTPFMRTHAQLKPEPYHYPELSDISHKYIRMRYEWLPYNYTLAFENATEGLPPARPLNFSNSSSEKEMREADDEYLWGDNVLVAPVMIQGARTRDVYFPKGVWVDWWNPDMRFTGGAHAVVEAPLDMLPLFVKAGSFIPQFEKKISNVGEYDPSRLTIFYFHSDTPSSYTLFDDNRLSPLSLNEGAYQLTTFSASPGDTFTEISLSSNGGIYSGMPPYRDFTFRIPGMAASSVTLSDGTPMPQAQSAASPGMQTWWIEEESGTLCLRIQWTYEPLSIRINY